MWLRRAGRDVRVMRFQSAAPILPVVRLVATTPHNPDVPSLTLMRVVS
jgi:hypothetical protein